MSGQDAQPTMASMPWASPEPGRLVGRGNPAGDFLEAWAWDVLEEDVGHLRVSAHAVDRPPGDA